MSSRPQHIRVRADRDEDIPWEVVALAVAVAIQWIVNWHFASRSFFVADDFVLFHDALKNGFTAGSLFAIQGDHFSPGRRLVTQLLQHTGFDFHVALGLLLATHSVGVVLLQRSLRVVFGPRWWTVVVAFAYGISIVVQPSLQWYSAGVLILPGATLGLAAIYCYLRWWQTRRRAWVVWSCVAFVCGLLFYEKALLIPLYILLVRVFLLEPDTPVRKAIRGLGREWRVWVLYATPAVIAVTLYLAKGNGGRAGHVPVDVIVRYIELGWSAAFVPALLGIRTTSTDSAALHTAIVVGCQVALAGTVSLSVWRRRSAWRSWAVLALAFLVNLPFVIPRLNVGADVAYVLRYFTEPAYFAALVIPFAFVSPFQTHVSAAIPHRLRPATVAALIGLVAYSVVVWAGSAAFTRHWPGLASRAWMTNLSADVDAVRRHHVEPVLLDGPVPPTVEQFWIVPKRLPGGNFFSAVVPTFRPGLRFDEVSSRTYRVRDDGHLEAVEFRPVVAGTPQALQAHGVLKVAGHATMSSGQGLCLGRDGRPVSLEWRPIVPLLGRSWYLQTTYRTDLGGLLGVFVDRGLGYPFAADRVLPPEPKVTSWLTMFGALPTGVPTLTRFRVNGLPGHSACFRRLAVGYYMGRSTA